MGAVWREDPPLRTLTGAQKVIAHALLYSFIWLIHGTAFKLFECCTSLYQLEMQRLYSVVHIANIMGAIIKKGALKHRYVHILEKHASNEKLNRI